MKLLKKYDHQIINSRCFIRHPTCLTPLYSDENKCFVIAMPRCENTLVQYIENSLYEKHGYRRSVNGALEMIDVLHQITLALEYLHSNREHGIIHRDLKPGNIFIHRDQNGKRKIMLADFGLSKQLSQISVQHQSSIGNNGTEGWRSTDKILTSESDIQTLGQIFYYCLKRKTTKVEDLMPHDLRIIRDCVCGKIPECQKDCPLGSFIMWRCGWITLARV